LSFLSGFRIGLNDIEKYLEYLGSEIIQALKMS